MATYTNKYGLSRDIPADIKRAIRQKCGFGCIICGLFLYEYDHVDPPFPEAREHDSDKICLLCPNHHRRKTKGLISAEEIKEALRNPKAKELGYSRDSEFFVNCKRPIKVKIGNIVFDNPNEVIRIAGQSLLTLTDLEDGKLALSGMFYDSKGRLILEIDNNEWKEIGENWDVENVGNRLTIRSNISELSLSVVVESNESLAFDNVDLHYRDVRLTSRAGENIQISYRGKNVVQHEPNKRGGLGIEMKGPLIIDEKGRVEPIKGPAKIGAGKITVGSAEDVKKEDTTTPYMRHEPRIGRNDPCPCGSGKKYKRCHGR